MGKICAILIIENEQENIQACLEGLKWVDEVVVVNGVSFYCRGEKR